MDEFIPKPNMIVYKDPLGERYVIVSKGLDYTPPYDHFWAKRLSDGCLQYHRYNNHVDWKVIHYPE